MDPLWRRLIGKATDPSTWTGMFFLLAKLPLGFVAFVLTVVLLSASIAFTAAPVLHLAFAIPVGPWSVDSLGESLLLAPIGVRDRRPFRERAQLHGGGVRPICPPDARRAVVGERPWYRFHMNMTDQIDRLGWWGVPVSL